MVSNVPWVRAPWVVGQFWRAPTASAGGQYSMYTFIPMLLLLINSKLIPEIFDAMKTVTAVANRTTEYFRQFISVTKDQPLVERPRCPYTG